MNNMSDEEIIAFKLSQFYAIMLSAAEHSHKLTFQGKDLAEIKLIISNAIAGIIRPVTPEDFE